MKKRMFKEFLAVVTASVIAGAMCTGCKGKNLIDEKNMPISVQKLNQHDLQDYISVAGVVEGSNVVHVATELVAKVKSVNVEVGSKVQAGDVLCTFDSTELQEELNELTTAVQKGEDLQKKLHEKNVRALNEAKAEKTEALQNAQKAIDRADAALKEGKSAANLLDKQLKTAGDTVNELSEAIQSGVEEAVPYYNEAVEVYNALFAQVTEANGSLLELEAAVVEAKEMYKQTEKSCDKAIEMAQEMLDSEEESGENSAKKQLDALKKQIDNCVVKATCSGMITAINIAEGSIPANATLMTIEDTDTLRIKVAIPETDILSVEEGQKAIVRTVATGEEDFLGEVAHVVKIISSSAGGYGYSEYMGGASASGYSAEIMLQKGDSSLLVGMNAKVKIILEEKNNVLAVPYDAVQTDDDEKSSVYVAELQSGDDYKVHSVPVEVGMVGDYFTEITAADLKVGDFIVTDNFDRVSDGAVIKITEGYNDTVGKNADPS